MVDSVQVSCIRKRGDHYDKHKRIEGLGGLNANGTRWYLPEEDIIAELAKPDATRRWDFFVSVGGRTVKVITATHEGRKYLKTQPDGYAPDNLLALGNCPA